MIADLTLVAPIRATIERGLIVPYGRHDALVYRCRSHRDGQVDLTICPVFLRQRALNDVSLSALAISSEVHCWRSWRGSGRSDVGSLDLESKDDRRQPAARAINERLLMVYLGHEHQLGNLFHAELRPTAKLG